MKKILIIHGWMHSSDRYIMLKRDMEKLLECTVDLYEIPGFGKTKPICYSNLLHYYSLHVRDVIAENEYDYVIGHSMGGNILLRALDMIDTKANLILLSPEYMGISYLKPLTIFCPIMPLGLLILQKIECKFTTFIMKLIALLTVNKWQQIDDRIIKDSRRANALIATVAMFELAWDSWRITSDLWKERKVNLLVGQNDRIILAKKMQLLRHDLCCCELHQITGIGHTAVVEAYDELLKIICMIINTGDDQ